MGGSTTSEAGFEVFRDDWGIPHLRAESALALARAQGHNAATDRAWQVETERHRLQGTTAAFLGEAALGWDRFARQARLDDTARRCFDRLDPGTAAWVTAYVDGVNAGLAEGARRSPEFAAAGLAPGRWQPWTPLGVWLSTHILFAGFPTKLWREEVARRLGDDAITLFATDGPGTSGSNGWLLTGERTVSGAPVIAGDPHRFVEDPGVYQQIRLACPEFDVVGLAVPGVPGLAHFGHTGGVAWAITNAMADYQDLYREQLRRTADGGVEALGPEGWETAHVHTESIAVSGGEPVGIEVVETARGPVVIGGPDAGAEADAASEAGSSAADAPALSLRYPPRVTGLLGFEVLPALLRARTVGDVDTALDGWVEPVNVVLAADTTGATLHRVAGYVPVRPRANQLRVVPAHDPAYAWHGRHAPMPRTASGADATGTAVMANERGLAAPLGVEFAPAHRAERIRELLGTGGRRSAEDMAAIHMDTRLASARPLLALLADTAELSRGAGELRDRLLRWDRHMEAAATDATLYSALRAAVMLRDEPGAGSPAQLTAAEVREIGERSGVGAWAARAAVWGDAEIVRIRLRRIRDAWGKIPSGRVVAPRAYAPFEYDEIVYSADQIMAGIPTLKAIENTPDHIAHVDFSPIVPMQGTEVRLVTDEIRKHVHAAGLNFSAAIMLTSERSGIILAGVRYDKTNADAVRNAFDVVKLMVSEIGNLGYGVCRPHIDFMDLAADKYSFNGHAYRRFVEKLKDAVDPKGILSPGRHGIWPAAYREGGAWSDRA